MRWMVALVALAGCARLLDFQSIDTKGISPPPPGDWAMVASGQDGACAIKLDGSLWCWGDNTHGQLGIGAGMLGVTEPTQVPIGTWSTVSLHFQTSCGIQTDGSLWCWGSNLVGQIGNGTMAGPDLFDPVRIDSRVWTEVAVGQSHGCAIASDGSLWCWGDNNDGETGTGDGLASDLTPTLVPAPGPWSGLTAGDGHTCAIAADRSVWCWGTNYDGQVGNGSYAITYTPSRVSSEPMSSLAAGALHTCAVRADGHLRCWGSNYQGELQNLDALQSPAPLAPDHDVDTWVSVTAGQYHTCGTNTSGQLLCWGGNTDGELGNTSTTRQNSAAILVDNVPASWTQISAGAHHTCGLSTDHNVWCFGRSGLGSSSASHVPIQIAGTWLAVSAGYSFTCAIDSSTKISCWGDNSQGQIGDSTFTRRPSPTVVSDAGFKSLWGGPAATCALDTANAMWCWGSAQNGLGDGAATRLMPTLINAGPWSQIAIGVTHSCALDLAGVLWCWGDNAYGELGTGDMMSYFVPHQAGSTVWTSITTGQGTTCGTSGGTLSCWGYNGNGLLGNGTQNNSLTPVTVGSGTQASLSYQTACEVDASGGAKCWGSNNAGQLGDGTTNLLTYSPVAVVGGASSWKTVVTSTLHTCGVGTDGSLWCWGDDASGALGDNSSMVARSPVRVGSESDWTAVVIGNAHTCGLRSGGTLWCWGDNTSGQLGIGSTGAGLPQLVPL